MVVLIVDLNPELLNGKFVLLFFLPKSERFLFSRSAVLLFVSVWVFSSFGLNGDLWGQCPPGSWILTGQVVDEAGNGIGGLDLDLNDPATGLPLILAGDFSLPDGSFSFTICQTVTPGTYLLDVNPDPDQLFFPLEGTSVVLNGSNSLGLLVLESAAIFQGRVVGENFEVLPFVDLDFTDSLTGVASQFSGDFTIADGSFSTKVSPGFWDVQFTASPASTTLQMVPRELRDTLASGFIDLGDIRLRQGRNLTGTVLNPSGAAVANVDLDARDLLTGEKIVTPGDNTNSLGVFQVLVPEGDFEIELEPPAASTLVPQLINISVPVGGLDMGTINLAEGVAVSGTVVDGNQVVVPGTDLDFLISATGIEIPTAQDNANSSGVFSVQVVPDTYDIAFRPTFATGLAPLVIPGVSVVSNTNLGMVTLPQGSALTGTVLANGVPVSDASLELLDPVSGQPVYLFGNDTDGLGAFAIRQIPGIYDLQVIPPLGSSLPTYNEPGVDLSADLNLAIDLTGTPPPTPPNPVTAFSCCCPGGVTLEWSLGDPDYDLIQIQRNGSFLTNLPGTASSFTDSSAPQQLIDYEVIALRNSLVSAPVSCSVDNNPIVVTFPVENLTCSFDFSSSGSLLSWTNGSSSYDSIEIYESGIFQQVIAGNETSVAIDYCCQFPVSFEWEVIPVEGAVAAASEFCILDVSAAPGSFIRGDANGDNTINLADAIGILQYLFNGSAVPDCLKASDIDDSSNVNIGDAISLLAFLFSGGPAPEPPFPNAGSDPTPDSLICN